MVMIVLFFLRGMVVLVHLPFPFNLGVISIKSIFSHFIAIKSLTSVENSIKSNDRVANSIK
jgi:hypothetical protein